MRGLWRDGKRGDEFYDAVWAQFPSIGVQTYNRAADAAWPRVAADDDGSEAGMTTSPSLPDPSALSTGQLLDLDVDLRRLRGDPDYREWLLNVVGQLCQRGVSVGEGTTMLPHPAEEG
jgi:hypothetical protein